MKELWYHHTKEKKFSSSLFNIEIFPCHINFKMQFKTSMHRTIPFLFKNVNKCMYAQKKCLENICKILKAVISGSRVMKYLLFSLYVYIFSDLFAMSLYYFCNEKNNSTGHLRKNTTTVHGSTLAAG